MKRLPTILILIFFTSILSAQQSLKNDFPDDFLGIYKGSLHINSESSYQEIPMEFHFTTTDSIGQYNYILVYGEGDTRQQRDYTLIEKESEKGQYTIDENNGIILDATVLNNKMYCLFEVEGNLLTTFISFGEEDLTFEIVFASRKNENLTYGDNEEKTEVHSFPISTVQRARLLKQ